ncbi:hypothetical protein [Mycobacterium simiae]|nr:hypothetical protein [Mycobacterium simiae]
MHRQVCLAVGAVTVGATLGLLGCSHDEKKASTEPSVPPASSIALPPRSTASLPAPDALVAVLSRLADPAVAGADKAILVEGATPETVAALDRFTAAARDDGYLPMSFAANNIAWSDVNAWDVMATIVVTTANADNREFTFPMEFTPRQGGWQLSRRTAEMLLVFSRSSSPGPRPTPAPAPNSEFTLAPTPTPTP